MQSHCTVRPPPSITVTPAAPSEDPALEATSENLANIDPAHPDEETIAKTSSTTETDSNASTESAGVKGWWKVFASTYVTIFLAEIGDKTQVTTLLMSAESHKPWMVFAGAGTALVCTSLLGVLLGRWLATRLKPRTLELGAGITLLSITVGLGWDIFQGF